jgi:hypothetical protein
VGRFYESNVHTQTPRCTLFVPVQPRGLRYYAFTVSPYNTVATRASNRRRHPHICLDSDSGGGVYSSELRGRNLKKENVGQMEFGNVNAHRLASTGLGQFSADDSWFTACFLVSPRHVFLSHLLHSIRQNSENTKEGANERTNDWERTNGD